MKLAVNDQVHLSEFRSSDKPALIQHLNDPDIYHRTLRIPCPYTDAAADEWLALVAKITHQQGRPVHWAIRTAEDALMGGCGFDGFQVGKSHRAEVGYWLAKPFWGRGIMTAVVRRVCRHAFEEFGLVKIAVLGQGVAADDEEKGQGDKGNYHAVLRPVSSGRPSVIRPMPKPVDLTGSGRSFTGIVVGRTKLIPAAFQDWLGRVFREALVRLRQQAQQEA